MSFNLLRKVQFQFWRLAEGRSIFEWQSFYLLQPLLRQLKSGDGHPVIVFPGFVGSDISTKPMRKLLDDLGYSSYGWGLGRNVIFDQKRENEMRNLIRNVCEKEGRKVSLIGWSLGGVFARETAKLESECVRSVISLGSPISGDPNQTNVGDLFKALNGNPSSNKQSRFSRLKEAPPMPTTSIYSKTDGIVAWEGSIQPDAPQTENIEVPASHLGLGVNPFVMYAIADRLSQAEGSWKPFDKSGFKSLVFSEPNESWSSKLKAVFA